MENPRTSSSSPRRRRISSDSNSPEFEFWMLRNPSFPQPNLLSADELFSDGVLLPLHLLPQNPDGCSDQTETQPPDHSEPPVTDQELRPGPEILSAAVTESSSVLTGSKRWKDIFKKSDKKSATAAAVETKEKDKERKREKKSQLGASSAAELNIHIWPFSRSRSAGNGGARPRISSGAAAAGGRKVSSAPCSRSNSAGESKSRKWPSSPGRTGVHLGRSSPVWQVRRSGSGRKNPNLEPTVSKKEIPHPRRSKAAGGGDDGGRAKARVLNLNVPMCIGYRNQINCRSNQNSAITIGGGSESSGGGGGDVGGVNMGSGGTLFNIRNLFTKKVY